MNKKGQFLARDWVISIILFSGLVALIVLAIASMSDQYDNPDIVNNDIAANYGNITETTQIAQSAFDAANEKEGLTFVGSIDVMFGAAFTVIALTFNSVGLATGYLTSFASDFKIPSSVAVIVVGILISILMVILVFVILSTTTQRDF